MTFVRIARRPLPTASTYKPRGGGHCPLYIMALMASLLFGVAAFGQTPNALPPTGADLSGNSKPAILRDVNIEQRLNAQVPGDLIFRDETGKSVRLDSYFHKRPIILCLVYFRCPMLCTLCLNNLTRSLQSLQMNVGDQFDIITVSFDPDETYQLAAEKKESYLRQYHRDGAAAGWHFLTGDEPSIRKLTQAVGFHYVSDPNFSKAAADAANSSFGMGDNIIPSGANKFAHPSGIIILTPEGRVSRYFFGIDYAPNDLRLSLTAASDQKIGSLTDTILAFCFCYNPATGKYSLAILRLMKLGGIITLALMAAMWFALHRVKRPVVPAAAGGAPSGGTESKQS